MESAGGRAANQSECCPPPQTSTRETVMPRHPNAKCDSRPHTTHVGNQGRPTSTPSPSLIVDKNEDNHTKA